MGDMVKVRVFGSDKVTEVTREEAQKMLENTFNSSMGGIVANAKTGEMILRIDDEIDEILIIEQMLGGG
jgi:hypothetical protein